MGWVEDVVVWILRVGEGSVIDFRKDKWKGF